MFTYKALKFLKNVALGGAFLGMVLGGGNVPPVQAQAPAPSAPAVVQKVFLPIVQNGEANAEPVQAAWVQPSLVPLCAKDATHYEWQVTLAKESNYSIDYSFDNFAHSTTVTMQEGVNNLTTLRSQGSTLYVRWSSDHASKSQVTANGTLCATATPTKTPTPTNTPVPPTATATKTPTPTATPSLITAKGNGSCEVSTSEWHWVITGVTLTNAPPSITVDWGGVVETIPLDKVVGSVAHYQTTSHGPGAVPVATTFVFDGWTGQFNLSHKPCPSTPTPTSTPTNTPVPPTATPTNTATNTPVPPTATPTNTPVPPTATPTNTATNTPVPPTATPTNTATNTPVPPTATPTNTATNTPVPPTATPTDEPLKPTSTEPATPTPTSTPTPTNTPTNTPVPPTATPTNTPVPPTATPTPTSTPVLQSIGNLVWKDDDGVPGTNPNRGDGVRQTGEPPLAGVVMKLYDASSQVLATTTTDSNGYYRFDNLVPANYFVCVDESNFSGLLAGYGSSAGQVPGFASTTNNMDHGAPLGAFGVCSQQATLGVNNPTGEVDAGATGQGANGPTGDENDTLTVDFSFFMPPTGIICAASGEAPAPNKDCPEPGQSNQIFLPLVNK